MSRNLVLLTFVTDHSVNMVNCVNKITLTVVILYLTCCQCAPNDINSVSKVDLLRRFNSKKHKTSMFYANINPPENLIIRRSEVVQIRIHFKSPFYEVDRLQLHLIFRTSRHTHSVFIPSKTDTWPAKFKFRPSAIDVAISIPNNAPVGFWDLNIYTYRNDDIKSFNTYKVKDILILFNPWSPNDAVYMPNSYDLNEYVLNEKGFVVTGDSHSMDKIFWIFGQFKPSSVKALKLVLNKLTLSPKNRGNPVLFSRALSAIVNAHEDWGMMAGKWSEPYDSFRIGDYVYEARSPLSWTGTPEIFEEYIKSNGRTIGFAQCWVFANLLTTLGRCLGIPSRSITNFDSGHDSDENVTISYLFDKDDKIVTKFSESIWNFHVWTEMYMKRYDLSRDGKKFGGWQIVDGTPQAISYDTPDKLHQMGPASRVAVKKAEVNMLYDTGFAYAEVNADIIHRNYLNEVTNYFENSVGRDIQTRGLDGDCVDLTSAYKELEGTMEERRSFRLAIKRIYNLSDDHPSIAERAVKKELRDILVNVNDTSHHKIGSKVYFHVLVRNQYGKARNFNVSIDVYSMYYNGKRANTIFTNRYRITLPANTENTRIYEIDPKDYIYKLVPFAIVRMQITIKTPKRVPFKQMFDLKFRRPTLIIKPNGKAVVGKPFYVDVQLINPLQVPLTKCLFSVQGLRLNADLHPVKTVKPLENKIYRVALVFQEAMTETVIFQFISKELYQVQGEAKIKVFAR